MHCPDREQIINAHLAFMVRQGQKVTVIRAAVISEGWTDCGTVGA